MAKKKTKSRAAPQFSKTCKLKKKKKKKAIMQFNCPDGEGGR